MKEVVLIVGTRPNFIKAAALYPKLKEAGFNVIVINTGQHYDKELSSIFLQEFNLPVSIDLAVGNEENIYTIAEKIKAALLPYQAEYVIVFGDVRSSLSGAIAAKMVNKKLIHIEAGCRTFDWNTHEEINRYFIDSISFYLFVWDNTCLNNLFNEKKVGTLVGNIMLDVTHRYIPALTGVSVTTPKILVATLHRNELLSNKEALLSAFSVLILLSKWYKVKLFVHPHLRNKIAEYSFNTSVHHEWLYEPLPYNEFLLEIAKSSLVLTDSGGTIPEAILLNKPCVCYRARTEHTDLLHYGHVLVSQNTQRILDYCEKAECSPTVTINRGLMGSQLGDGKATDRIVHYLNEIVN